jgi:hypothetical protein
MRRTTAALLAVLLATGAAACSSKPSYDDVVKGCQKALADQAKAGMTGKGKPSACGGVKKDDYDALVMSNAIDGLGWTDKDGNFDENKMLDSVTPQP